MKNNTCKDCLWLTICKGEEEICDEFNPLWDLYINKKCIQNRQEWFEVMDCDDDEFVENIDDILKK